MTLSCMVYSGVGGFVMMCLLGTFTIAAFIFIYAYKRFVLCTERRHPKVFCLDFSKMLIATGTASLVNYTFTAKVSLAASKTSIRGKPLEGIGWYAAICTMDVLVGTPISILTGRLLNCYCRRHIAAKVPTRPSRWDFLNQNAYYGKYSDLHVADADYEDEMPPVSLVWWYSQTVTWTICFVLSGLLSGLVVLYSFTAMQSTNNPVAWIAASITFWNVSCLTKQWLVVCFSRGILAYLNYAIIDFFNKYQIVSAF